MNILHSLLNELKAEFSNSRKGKERWLWFVYTIAAIIIPFTSSLLFQFKKIKRTFKFGVVPGRDDVEIDRSGGFY